MAVVINEVVTEVVLGADAAATPPSSASPAPDGELVELMVRRATERVLETLRREWDR